MVGVGSNNSRGAFDNVRVQVLPPQLTLDVTEDFAGEPVFALDATSGAWSVSADGRFGVTTGGGISLLDLGPDHLSASSYLSLEAKVNTAGRAGFVFDRYDDGSFKFVAIDAVADQVVIGYYTPKRGWVSEAVAGRPIDAGVDYTLGVALKGSTVSVSLNGQAIVGHAFYATTLDGRFGLMASAGAASFDDVRVKTDDPAFLETQAASLIAAATQSGNQAGSTVTQAELDAIATVVISQWSEALGNGDARLAAFGDVRFVIGDLGEGDLGHAEGSTIVIDADGAGVGWYVDVSPAESSEFRVRLDRNVLAAAPGSEAYGRFDLVTVLAHELGHVLGFDHGEGGETAVMREDLDPGVRYTLAPPERSSGRTPAFDMDTGLGAIGASAGIDWQGSASGSWALELSPYAPPKPVQPVSANLAQFELKPLEGQADHEEAGFDRLGRELLGKGKTGR
jgi:hypothetical protein